MEKYSLYGLPISEATHFQVNEDQGNGKIWNTVSGSVGVRHVTNSTGIATKLKRPLDQKTGEQVVMQGRKVMNTGKNDQTLMRSSVLSAKAADVVFCVSWAEDDEIICSYSGGNLHPGKYPTSLTFHLRAHASLQRLSFRFELQGLEHSVQGKIESICKKVREDILVAIKVPVEDAKTGQRRIMTATPCCIVAHSGRTQSSGHYVTLEKTPEGWLLHDDDKDARLQDSLESFLNESRKRKFTPYLVAYDVLTVTTVFQSQI